MTPSMWGGRPVSPILLLTPSRLYTLMRYLAGRILTGWLCWFSRWLIVSVVIPAWRSLCLILLSSESSTTAAQTILLCTHNLHLLNENLPTVLYTCHALHYCTYKITYIQLSLRACNLSLEGWISKLKHGLDSSLIELSNNMLRITSQKTGNF